VPSTSSVGPPTMKKANQGAQKFTRLIENYELDEAAIILLGQARFQAKGPNQVRGEKHCEYDPSKMPLYQVDKYNCLYCMIDL